MRTYISNIEYELGILVDIDDILADEPEEIRGRLRKIGFRRCSVHEGDLTSLAEASFRRLLAAPESAGVDALIVAQRDAAPGLSPDLSGLLSEAGLNKLPLLEVGGMDCSNLVCAIIYATALLEAGLATKVACCFACKVEPGDRRVTPNNSAIIADGSVSCLVGSEPGDFEVIGRAQSTDMALVGAEHRPDHMMRYFGFCRGVHGSLGVARFDHLVSANVPLALDIFSKLSGGGCGRPFVDNIAAFAHVSSGDVLMNLKDLHASGERGEVLACGIGQASVAMLHLRA